MSLKLKESAILTDWLFCNTCKCRRSIDGGNALWSQTPYLLQKAIFWYFQKKQENCCVFFIVMWLAAIPFPTEVRFVEVIYERTNTNFLRVNNYKCCMPITSIINLYFMIFSRVLGLFNLESIRLISTKGVGWNDFLSNWAFLIFSINWVFHPMTSVR